MFDNNYINSYPDDRVRSSHCSKDSTKGRCSEKKVNNREEERSETQRMTYGLVGYPLASVYAPLQSFSDIYDCETGLVRGTIFSELDLPFVCGGMSGGVNRG